jgi:hypothetical protein
LVTTALLVAAGGVRAWWDVVWPVRSSIPQDRRNKKETQGEWTQSQSSQSAGAWGRGPEFDEERQQNIKLNINAGIDWGRGPLSVEQADRTCRASVRRVSGTSASAVGKCSQLLVAVKSSFLTCPQ